MTLCSLFPSGSGTVFDEITEAGIIHKYFSEGHTYEVILDFLGTKHNIFPESEHLKEKTKECRLNKEDRLYSHWHCECSYNT